MKKNKMNGPKSEMTLVIILTSLVRLLKILRKKKVF